MRDARENTSSPSIRTVRIVDAIREWSHERGTHRVILQSLFDEIVRASGLATVIAGPAIRRALSRAGADPARLTPADLAKSMDALEACLRVYLPRDEVEPRMEALRGLVKERHFS